MNDYLQNVSGNLNTESSSASKSPVPDAQINQQASSSTKHVPNKSIEDGTNNSNKRVSSKPKWNRLDVDAKISSNYGSSQQSSRRRSPPRGRGRGDDRDYYRDERPVRRVGSNRSNASASTRSGAPRGGSGSTVSSANGTTKPSSTTSRQVTSASTRRGAGDNAGSNASAAYITRSNRPSYTESKTPGLNGNPILKPSDAAVVSYDAKKQPKPLLGRPIIIEAPIPVIPNVWTNGATYYFSNPPPFAIDAIENIKESIKKQM